MQQSLETPGNADLLLFFSFAKSTEMDTFLVEGVQ